MAGENPYHQSRQHQPPSQQRKIGHVPAAEILLVADRLIRTIVDAFAQVFARLEMRHMFAGERHCLAGLGIASLPRRPKMQREAAETAYLDALAGRQRIAHDFEELLDRQLDILRRQMLLLRRYDLNEFRFRHYRSVRITRHIETGRPPLIRGNRPCIPSILAGDLLLEEVSQARSGGRIGPIILHGLLLLVDVLRLDGQRNTASLAVHTGKSGLDFLANLEQQARILDPIARQLGGAQLAVDAVAEVDDRPLGIDFAHHAFDDAALRMFGDIRGEWILRELLDAEADALALGIDRQHHGIDLLRLLIAAHGLFARHVPRDIGQMHQAVDAAGQADEYAEIGDRFDLAADLVAAVVIVGEFLPRIGLALLDAQADAPALLVDVEHHDFDFLPNVHDLRRVDVLVGPIHFRDVHQTLDALFDFNEAAVVGDIRHLAEQTRIGRIAPRDVLPWIGAELLQSQRDPLPFAV